MADASRPNGTARMSPGSSSSSCWGRTMPAYKIFDERFPFLFNSYYVAAGPRHARPQRGLITRPNGDDVAAYRAHVDAAVERLIEQCAGRRRPRGYSRFWRSACITSSSTRSCCSPTSCTPSRRTRPIRSMTRSGTCRSRRKVRAALSMSAPAFMPIGHDGHGFCFDNETPRHDELIPRCAHRPRISSPMPNGSHSSTPAATRRPRSGCRTAGPWCRPKAGRRPAIGGAKDGGWTAMTLGWPQSSRSGGAGHPRQLLRSRGLRPLCRQAPAERGGMGGRGSRRRDRRRLRRGLAMDAQRLSALSGLPRRRRARSANTTASSW